MARAIWKHTLAVTLAWAGFGWTQQPPAGYTDPAAGTAPATAAERIVTVQETGQPSHQCRVLQSWQPFGGPTAYKVQTLDRGETLTILESGPITSGPGSQTGTRRYVVAARIFHWSRPNTSPADAPVPPDEGIQQVSMTATQPASAPLSANVAAELPSNQAAWNADSCDATGSGSNSRVLILPPLRLDEEADRPLVPVVNDGWDAPAARKEPAAAPLTEWHQPREKADAFRSVPCQADKSLQEVPAIVLP
jgi:hypothetical protein